MQDTQVLVFHEKDSLEGNFIGTIQDTYPGRIGIPL